MPVLIQFSMPPIAFWQQSGRPCSLNTRILSLNFDYLLIKTINTGFEKNVFISAANFKYPTVKLNDLKTLEIQSIAEADCILFMWTTGPQMSNSIEFGEAWGFEYKTVAFVWDKQVQFIIMGAILYHKQNLF